MYHSNKVLNVKITMWCCLKCYCLELLFYIGHRTFNIAQNIYIVFIFYQCLICI